MTKQRWGRLLIASVVMSAAGAASAGQVAFSVATAGDTSYWSYDLETRTVSPGTAALVAGDSVVFTADGLYALTANATGTLEVRDLRTGVVTTFPTAFRPIVAQPGRTAVFGSAGIGQLARLDARGVVLWSPCGTGNLGLGVAPTPDGAKLYVMCPSGDLAVLDADTGVELSRVSVSGAAGILNPVVGLGDTHVAIARFAVPDIALVEVATGRVVRTRATTSLARLTPVPGGQQFVEAQCPNNVLLPCVFRLIDFNTLATVRDLGAASMFHRTFVTADGRDLVINDIGSFYFESGMTRVDLATGVVIDQTSAPFGTTFNGRLLPAPHAPKSLSATVTGASVALSWQLPDDSPTATSHRLIAGARPGGNDVGTFRLGTATAFAVAGVPSGRYYVRVRAENPHGQGPSSNEVVVDVP